MLRNRVQHFARTDRAARCRNGREQRIPDGLVAQAGRSRPLGITVGEEFGGTAWAIWPMYSGNVTTDASGKATVSLPDYFEAINKDFRYQLTVIGSFAQAIVSKEVINNKFEIATNQPNIKVSWEVKGVRNDARMKMNPFVAVEEKSAVQKGKYWDPVSHNQPLSKGVTYDANIEFIFK